METIGEKLSYDSTTKLGEGGYAIVYKGLFEGLKEVAIKRIQQAHVNHPINTNEHENERKIMLEVSDHPNILRYICYETNKDFL